MAILPILTYPDPRLLRVCRTVEKVDQPLIELAESMAETMYAAPGIGLAAPQVGADCRLVVVDVARNENRGNPFLLFNPQIMASEGETVYEEGCLSVPGLTADVTRRARVVVQAMDRDGNSITLDAEGILAICLQHEMDHLDGRLFLERISPLKRALYKKRRAKQLRKEGE